MTPKLQPRLLGLCPIVIVLLSILGIAWAQAPVGIVAGVITDATGAVIPTATILLRNKGTGIERTVRSGSEGGYSIPTLQAGEYQVRVAIKGFRTQVRDATVQTGLTTTVDFRLSIGETTEVVNVEAASAAMEYEKNAIDGVVTRQVIQDLPLNGRSFLQLASIEPGVTVNPGTISQYNSLFGVSIMGSASDRTNITVDGGNIRNPLEGNSQMNFSQEVVEEFQLSSVNFDLSTGITSTGSVNIVTRSGSNNLHGSAYFFYRDHNMAAYPDLGRNPFEPNPYFARKNPGFWIGGPIKKDKLFFFFNYEYMNQVQTVSVQPNLPSVASLAGNFGSPYSGATLSGRLDYHLNDKNSLFLRYSHDGNSGFGPTSNAPLPSNWLRNTNWSDQAILGATTIFRPTLVNDFRFDFTFWSNRNLFPNSSDCSGCLGLDGPQVTFAGIASSFEVGDTSNATQGRDLRQYGFDDGLTWQKGAHRMRFGAQFAPTQGTGFWGYCDPACAEVFPPEFIEAELGPLTPVLFPNLPTQIRTTAQLESLPFAGAEVGVGNPAQPPPYNLSKAEWNDRYRAYFEDTWRIRPSLTLNYGLAYEYESNLFNEDLTKPAYLAPLYGSNLNPTQPNRGNLSPLLGFAWNVGHNNKTVIRGGAGIYYDTEDLYRRLEERSEIGPVGNGRIEEPSTAYTNLFPGIVNEGVTAAEYQATGKLTPDVIPVGAPLPASAITNLTLGQFIQIVQQESGQIEGALAPGSNSLAVRTIDVSKTGSDLLPYHYPVPKSYHMSLGVQREVRRDLVVSADFVRRVFENTLVGNTDIDLNHFNAFVNGVQTPAIPVCPAAQSSTPGVECSNGPITFWVPQGRSTYTALLVKADKRFSNRYQFLVSYALQSEMAINGVPDFNNYFASWGPAAPRNILSITGVVNLPWGFQLGLISTTQSRGPAMPIISGIDISGSGSGYTPLPGLSYNCLNISCGPADLSAAVNSFNATYAGKKDATGKVIPTLSVPGNYFLGRVFNSQDVRLTKTFTFHERYKFSVLGEMFNILNYSNVSGETLGINSPEFGIPTERFTQVFGSGGPRALQLGSRFSF